MAKGTLNYTDRIELTHLSTKPDIKIEADNDTGTFTAEIELMHHPLPDDGRVFLEAIFRDHFIRYDYGTVANQIEPPNTSIAEFRTENPKFRVKVVGSEGVLLARSKEIRVFGIQGLLQTEFENLHQNIWQLDIEYETGPVLKLNNKLIESSDDTRFYQRNPAILLSALTSVVEKIMFHLHFYQDKEMGWQQLWLIALDLEPEKLEEWQQQEDSLDVHYDIEVLARQFINGERGKALFDRTMKSIAGGE